ncbi:uncharacterized protein LOC110977708 [Acanthaster planci]|uniref:Uncharacterized protein LOC110977708 n=1 Tax=Acanthaster planci TaxID=133434 RepID=A0A8B7Y7J9_ACAPL|nr:uncharacterized protein LOC110977708 [Acanthaster planci]
MKKLMKGDDGEKADSVKGKKKKQAPTPDVEPRPAKSGKPAAKPTFARCRMVAPPADDSVKLDLHLPAARDNSVSVKAPLKTEATGKIALLPAGAAESIELKQTQNVMATDLTAGWCERVTTSVRRQSETPAICKTASSMLESDQPSSLEQALDKKTAEDNSIILDKQSLISHDDSDCYAYVSQQQQRKQIMQQILQELSSDDESPPQTGKAPGVLKDETVTKMVIPPKGISLAPSKSCWLETSAEDQLEVAQDKGMVVTKEDEVLDDEPSSLPETTFLLGKHTDEQSSTQSCQIEKATDEIKEDWAHSPSVEREATTTTPDDSKPQAANRLANDTDVQDIEDGDDNEEKKGEQLDVKTNVSKKALCAIKQMDDDYNSWDEGSDEEEYIKTQVEKPSTGYTTKKVDSMDELLREFPPSSEGNEIRTVDGQKGTRASDRAGSPTERDEKVERKEEGLTEFEAIEQMLQQSSSDDLFGIVDKVTSCKGSIAMPLTPQPQTVTSPMKKDVKLVESTEDELCSLTDKEERDIVVENEMKSTGSTDYNLGRSAELSKTTSLSTQSKISDLPVKPETDAEDLLQRGLNSVAACKENEVAVKSETKTTKSTGDTTKHQQVDSGNKTRYAVDNNSSKPTEVPEHTKDKIDRDSASEDTRKRKIRFSDVSRGPTITGQRRGPLKGILKQRPCANASPEQNTEWKSGTEPAEDFLADCERADASKDVTRDVLSEINATKPHEDARLVRIHHEDAHFDVPDTHEGSVDSGRSPQESSSESEDSSTPTIDLDADMEDIKWSEAFLKGLDEETDDENDFFPPKKTEAFQDGVHSPSLESSSESDVPVASPVHDDSDASETIGSQTLLDCDTQGKLRDSLLQAGKPDSAKAFQDAEVPCYLRDDFNPAPEQKPFKRWDPMAAKKKLDKISQSKKKLPESPTPRWLKTDFNPDGSGSKREVWKAPSEKPVLCSTPDKTASGDADIDCGLMTDSGKENLRKQSQNESQRILDSMRSQEKFQQSSKTVTNPPPSTPAPTDKDLPRFLRPDFDPAPEQKPFKRWNPVEAKKKFTKIANKTKLPDATKKTGRAPGGQHATETPCWLQPDFDPSKTEPVTTPALQQSHQAPQCNKLSQRDSERKQIPDTSLDISSAPMTEILHQPEAAWNEELRPTVDDPYADDPAARYGASLTYQDAAEWMQMGSGHLLPDHHCALNQTERSFHQQQAPDEHTEVMALGSSSVPAWLQSQPQPPQDARPGHMPALPGVKPNNAGLSRHRDRAVAQERQTKQDSGVRTIGLQPRAPPSMPGMNPRRPAITPKWMQSQLSSALPQATPPSHRPPPNLPSGIQVLDSSGAPSWPDISATPQPRGTLNKMPALPGVNASKRRQHRQEVETVEPLPSGLTTIEPMATLGTRSLVGRMSHPLLLPTNSAPPTSMQAFPADQPMQQVTAASERSLSSGAPSPEPPRYNWMKPEYGQGGTAWLDSTNERRTLLNSIARTQAARRLRNV